MLSFSCFGGALSGSDAANRHVVETAAAVLTITLLGIIAVVLRIVARRRASADLAGDDYVLLVSLIFAIGTAVCCLDELGEPSTNTIFQMNWVYSELNSTSVTLTKISILLFYERIFKRSWMTRSCMVLCALFWTASTVLFLVGCRPISWYWNRVTDPEGMGECIDTEQFYFWTGVCDTVLDALVLVVPIQNVYKLQMSTVKKISVCGVFMLGIFVIIAGIQRAAAMGEIPADNPTWPLSCSFVWTCAEPMVGVICACLPTYAILFRARRKNTNPWASKSMPQWYHWSRWTSRIRSSHKGERSMAESNVVKFGDASDASTGRDSLAFGYEDV